MIISSLKTLGILSGAFIGYKYGFVYKTHLCSNPFFKNYDDLYINTHFTDDTLPESIFYNSIGLFTGIMVGYYIYPIVIPTMIYQLHNIDDIKNFIKLRC
jgi:hypothetical protein